MRVFNKKENKESGAIIVEATISLSFFIFTMFIIYSIVDICYIQARMNIALSYAAQNISQYSYLYYKTGTSEVVQKNSDNASAAKSTINEVKDGLGSLQGAIGATYDSANSGDLQGTIDGINQTLETGKADKQLAQNIYQSIKKAPGAAAFSLASVAIEYAGNKACDMIGAGMGKAFAAQNLQNGVLDTDQFLKKYHVVDGVNGLDFSDTTYLSNDTHDDVFLRCKYTVQVPFSKWIDIPLEFEAKAHTRAWGAGVSKVSGSSKQSGPSAWDKDDDKERGREIEREMGKNYKYTASKNKQCDFYDPTSNTVINVTTLDPSKNSYAGNPTAIRDRIQKTFDMSKKIDGNVIRVKDASENETYLDSDAATRKVKVIVVIPDDADQSDVQAAEDSFKSENPNVEVEINTNYGHKTKKEEDKK